MLKTEEIKLPAITIKRGALGTIEVLGHVVEIPTEDVTVQPEISLGSKTVIVDMASFYTALKDYMLAAGPKPPAIPSFSFPRKSKEEGVKAGGAR
jgi:hypothetical protein